jgi:hypothetical protein
LQANGTGIEVIGETPRGEQSLFVDEIIATTGSRPDTSFLSELRVSLDSSVESPPTLAPLIDPNIHSCGTVPPHGEAELRHPEKDFYIVGMKSYGRAPTFLLATGYEQVRSVVAGLVGDWEAAREVQLNLPETGLCKVDYSNTNKVQESACCGGTSVVENVPVAVGVNTIALESIGGTATAVQPLTLIAQTDTCCGDSCCGGISTRGLDCC